MLRVALALVTAALLAAGCAAGASDSDGGARRVSLALDFAPNAAHAGVYTAVGRGEDRARGIALEVRSPSSSTDSVKLLASGATDFAIVDIHDLGLARERGTDIVGIGAIVQRPLAAVIARPDVERPRDLEGRQVGVTGLPSDDAVLRSVVEDDGGDYQQVRRVTIGFSAVPSLIEGSVDAVTAFWSVEGVTLTQRDVPTREFRVDRFGAPRYPELVLAARSETVAREPELVRSLLRTIEAGTAGALEDPAGAASEVASASGTDEELVRAQLDALAPALRPPIELDPRELERWAAFDQRFGILRSRPDVEQAFALDLGPSG